MNKSTKIFPVLSAATQKLVLVIIIAGMSLSLLYGCSNASTTQKNMYEDNTLISKKGDSYSFLHRVGETSDSKLEIQFTNFYGSQTIWNIKVEKQGEIRIEYDSNIKNGKFKAVLISENNEITNICEGNDNGSWTDILPEGKYRIKIVGYDSEGKAAMELNLDKQMSSKAINNG